MFTDVTDKSNFKRPGACQQLVYTWLKGLYGSPNYIKALPNLSSIACTSVAHSCLCSDACSWLGVCYVTGACVVSNACNYGTC